MAIEDQLREYLRRAAGDLAQARQQITELEEAGGEPIAVIGMSCRFPTAPSVEDYWELLSTGRSGVSQIPLSRWDADEYYDPERRRVGGIYTRSGAFLDDIAGWDADFFGVSPGEAVRMDPHQRLLMELVWEGLEDAGTSAAGLAGTRTAVMVGLMNTVQYGRLQLDLYGPQIAADPQFGAGVSGAVASGRLAYHFDLHGPTLTVDTACSSSLVATHLAMRALRQGDCEFALAAGVFLHMTPDTYVNPCAASMLSAGAQCRTFDRSADGYVSGEGGGVLLLQPLAAALRDGRRIRAVLRGSAVNQDGRSNGLTAPSRPAQAALIRQALGDARVRPDEVQYVEAHGSGTGLGDAIELSALHDVFGSRDPGRPLHVGAVKTNIGHTQSAAGVAGLIKTVLSLEHGVIPANLGLTDPSEAVPADGTIAPAVRGRFDVDGTGDAARPIAGVSGFGISGTNAHIVLQAAPHRSAPPGPVVPAPGGVVLPLSASTAPALAEQATRLAGWLASHPDTGIADVAHTLTSGRDEFDHRWAVVAVDPADAVRQLTAGAGGRPTPGTAPRIAFLLPGSGDEYAGPERNLGRELFRSEPVFADAVGRCVSELAELGGGDLLPFFTGPSTGLSTGPDLPGGPTADVLAFRLPEVHSFTVAYALGRLLEEFGVRARTMVGHGSGEQVAACLDGSLSLADALRIVLERSRPQVPGTTATVPDGPYRDVDVFVDLGPGRGPDRATRELIGGAAEWISVRPAHPVPAAGRASSPRAGDERAGLLSVLARLWELGVPVQWPSAPGRVVSLPSYPFQRQRFWPEAPEKPDSQAVPGPAPRVGGRSVPAGLTYVPTWRREPTRLRPSALRLPGTLVVLSDRHGVGSALAERAGAAGTRVVEVAAGGGVQTHRDGRRTIIDSARPEHYRELFASLPPEGPVHLVHLFSHEPAADGAALADDAGLRTGLHEGFDTLLLATQAIGAVLPGRPVNLFTVTRGAAEIVGADLRAPHRSVVHGLGRALHHEFPDIDWHGVDLDPSGEQAVEQLVHELTHELTHAPTGSGGALLAGWRNGGRWTSDWAELAPVADPEPQWRPDGVYLVTGGSRGLGRALARHLVAAGVRKLMLVSRNATAHDVDELTGAGAQVLRHDADVGDPVQLRQALRRCTEHFGALNGVVHAAGRPAGGMLQRQTVAGAHAVIAPKMLAMGPLSELLASATPPDVLVLYSSVVTAFGGIGEGDYCAANTVLDAYGAALSARAPGTRVATVAWGPWQHDDWSAAGGSVLSDVTRRNRREHGFTDEFGCALLDRVLAGDAGSVIAVGQPLEDIRAAFAGVLDLDALVSAGPAGPPQQQRSPRPPLRPAYTEPRTSLQKTICEAWASFLGLEAVGIHDPFFDLGGNSLVGLAMLRSLEQELSQDIAPALLFEHPTVAEFATVLERVRADEVVVPPALLNAGTDRGQRRRRARTDAGKK